MGGREGGGLDGIGGRLVDGRREVDEDVADPAVGGLNHWGADEVFARGVVEGPRGAHADAAPRPPAAAGAQEEGGPALGGESSVRGYDGEEVVAEGVGVGGGELGCEVLVRHVDGVRGVCCNEAVWAAVVLNTFEKLFKGNRFRMM
mmetsp:Transcript_35216/g.73758  ORF Transcript_35216/g.73758 Transcript_35216/m.73758 type:complete len:146 (+) Transcript_35216:136-573(+)